MEGQYIIYKLTSPSGKYYIGLTKNSLKERWHQHIKRAYHEQRNHPLYNAIRKYGADLFSTSIIDYAQNKQEAQLLEQKHIALSNNTLLYNVSPGGEADGETGSKIFWDYMNNHPEDKKTYLKKLSDTKKANDWTNYESLAEANKKWRKDNVREAYYASYRAIRMARRNSPSFQCPKKEDTRPLKERLMWKYKRNVMTQRNAITQWANCTEAKRIEINAKISKKAKERWDNEAILPNFNPEEWPYAKATVLKKIRQGLSRTEIIADAKMVVKSKGSHWREVKMKLEIMKEEI
jgi:group I intron endonuclease